VDKEARGNIGVVRMTLLLKVLYIVLDVNSERGLGSAGKQH
jgi:hypothetical protein